MFNKPIAPQVIGLELDAFMIRGIVVHIVRKKPCVKELFEYPILPEIGLSDSEEQKKLQEIIGNNLIAATSPTSDLLIRPLELKVQKRKDVESVFAFQAENLLPYPIENGVLDKLFLSQDKEGTKLTVLAARKDHVETNLKQWNEWGIDPEVLSAEPHGLAVFAKHFCQSPDAHYVLHIGIRQVLCIVVENGNLICSSTLPNGLEGILLEIARNNKTNQFSAYQGLSGIDIGQEFLKTPLEALRISVTRAIYALTKQYKGKNIASILITGAGANIPKLPEWLIEPSGKVLLTAREDLVKNINREDLNLYSIPLGTALSVLPLGYQRVNFRQGTLSYPAPWKRIKQPLILYCFLCLALSIALTIFGRSYINHQESLAKLEYLNLLEIMNKPYSEFEKEFAQKHTAVSAQDHIPQIDQLTNEDLQLRLQFLEKEIQSTPHTFPLQPNVPLVSDVLAWISSHPNFVGDRTDKKAPSLEIESFTYTVVKRPEPSKKQEKYQVKIELEFSSPSPKMAREFHDALIAPNKMVDPKAEIKWNSVEGKYRTSFYLKDKTFYPIP